MLLLKRTAFAIGWQYSIRRELHPTLEVCNAPHLLRMHQRLILRQYLHCNITIYIYPTCTENAAAPQSRAPARHFLLAVISKYWEAEG